MGILKNIRSRSKLKSQEELGPYPRPRGRDMSNAIPKAVLERIFTFVCPHVADETYEVSERSFIGDGCILCDLRDLSNCAKVNRHWADIAQDLLYHSVRIDAVHYCPLEEILAEQRRKKNVDPSTVPIARLRLLQRTVWAVSTLASRIVILKLPYMTRETAKGDLARTVSALPNLRYVDLPDGFFTGDATSQILRDELQAKCMDMRKMSYHSGAEQAFENLARYRFWMSLETLDLYRLDVEPSTLRLVLAILPALRDLNLRELPRLDNTLFQEAPGMPDLPPLQNFFIENAPSINTQGLVAYLDRLEVKEVLDFLSLKKTGITVPGLHDILSRAHHLTHLSITETVSRALPLEPIPPLTSQSLRTLNFEITSDDEILRKHATHLPSSTYYEYLSSSLHANSLPSLRKLYVRESDFAGLLLALPAPPAPGHAQGTSSYVGTDSTKTFHPRGLNQPLEIYAKGEAEHDWVFTCLSPATAGSTSSRSPYMSPNLRPNTAPSHNRGLSEASGTIGRPVSAYHASQGLGPHWSGEARKSVMVGNGAGGFLAVPTMIEGMEKLTVGSGHHTRGGSTSSMSSQWGPVEDSSWPRASKETRKSRGDLWR